MSRRRFRCRDCGYSFRLSRQAEDEALWELQGQSFSQVRRRLGIGYGALRRLLERRVNQEALSWLKEEEEAISLGIDEHSFRHQDMVYTVTEVKRRRVLGILKDDRIATLKPGRR
jgi:hypothetical protein